MVKCTPIKVLQLHILVSHDPLSSLAYPTITHTPPVAGNLPTKILGNGQQIHVHVYMYMYMYIYTRTGM